MAEDVRRKGSRNLRRMFSMETLTLKKPEDVEYTERFQSRRMSLNPESKMQEILRARDILPNKSLNLLTNNEKTKEEIDPKTTSGNRRGSAPRLKLQLPQRPISSELQEVEDERRKVSKQSLVSPPVIPTRLARGQPTSPLLDQTPEAGLEELLECPICLERLVEPKTLPCDHTFCHQCLKGQFESALGCSDGLTGIIRCPVCRKDAAVPRDGLAALPANVYLQSLLRLVSRRNSRPSQPSTPETPVQVELSSSSKCRKCGAEGHLSICGHCQKAICNQCQQSHLSELRENMIYMGEKLKTVSKRLEDAQKEYKDKFNQIRTQLKDETTKRLQRVQEESTRLMERLDSLENKWVEEGRTLLGRIESSDKHIASFDACTSERKVEAFLKASSDGNELLSEASRLNEVLTSFPSFDRSSFRILDPQNEEDEEEAVEERDKSRDLRRMDSKIQKRTKVLPNNHEELSLYYRTRSVSSPRWKFSGSRDLCRPAGVGIAPWTETELYMTLSDGGKVLVFTKRSSGSGWRHSKILPSPPEKEKMMCPFGIAFSEQRKEVFITDKWCHCIHVYDSEYNWLRRLSKQGRSPGHLSSPEGIAASDRFLFVADTGNDRVQVLEASNGGFVTFVGIDISSFRMEADKVGPSAGSAYLMQPTGIALTAEFKLIICDSGHNRIKIFDVSELFEGKSITNKPLTVFGSLGSQEGQFRSARGLTVDKLGFITVADSGNARVQIFRPDGRLVRAFGNKGKDPGDFGYPTSVHVGPNFELFVSDSSNHCMYVF